MNIKIIRNKSKNINCRKKIKGGTRYKNIIIYLLCFMFFIGVVGGIIYFKNALNNNFFEENPNLLQDLEIIIKNNKGKKEFLCECILKNIMPLVLIWIIGLSILGIPIIILWILYDGFSLGVTITYVLSTFGFYKGYNFLFLTFYVATLINTATLILVCNSAIRVTSNIVRQKSTLKQEFVRHSIVCVVMLVMLIISSIIEAYSVNFV